MQRTALIIGTDSKMDQAVARTLVAEGHRVAVAHSDLGLPGVLTVRCDLADPSTIDSAFDSVEDELGLVEILVINPSIPRGSTASASPEFDINQPVRVGLEGAVAAADRARDKMQRNGWGRMIFVASPSAMVGEAGAARLAGFSLNAGLTGLAESLTAELAEHGVSVNVVAPGLIEGDEEIQRGVGSRQHPMWHIPALRVGRLTEVAAVVSFLASDGAAYVNGSTVRVDGGIGIRPGVQGRL